MASAEHTRLLSPKTMASTSFDAQVPPASENRFAMAIGKYRQGIGARTGLYALCASAIGLGAATLAGQDVPQGPGLLLAGVLSAVLTWVVQNSPYDMLQALRSTIESMQSVGRGLEAGVATLGAENAELCETRARVQEEIEEAAVVRRGMQKTLNTLLSDIGNRNTSGSNCSPYLR